MKRHSPPPCHKAEGVVFPIGHHAQTIAITGRSYRLKDQVAVAGKEVKNKAK
jgi:hypothetical protein